MSFFAHPLLLSEKFSDQSCVLQGTAIAAVLAGKLAGHLRDQKGWNALRVRTFCQDVATLGRVLDHMQLQEDLPCNLVVVIRMMTIVTAVIINALCSGELGTREGGKGGAWSAHFAFTIPNQSCLLGLSKAAMTHIKVDCVMPATRLDLSAR